MDKNKLKRINIIFTLISFFVPFIIYFLTMAPTVSLWDCGEFIATSIIMGVPHPPGTPLYLLISNFFSQIPLMSDLGARVNFVSPIASALSIMLLYLIIIELIKIFSTKDSLAIYFSGLIAALTFSITDSQWFNAVEAEVYALSTFFTAAVVWLILKWASKFESSNHVKYFFYYDHNKLLSTMIHLMSLKASI